MPRLDLLIDLDNPKDYFEILDGDDFKGSKIDIKPDGRRLRIRIDAKTPKDLISAAGSVIKQIRIIEQTSELLKER